MVKDFVKRFLLSRGFILSRPPGQFAVWTIKLQKLKERGLQLNCVVDGGASDGGWTRELKSVYPQATVVCIEPREEEQPALKRLAQEMPHIIVAPALLGPTNGEVAFNLAGVASSALSASADARAAAGSGATAAAAGQQMTAMSTLDSLIEKCGAPQPDLIKLDLQGFEIDAMRGATRCMERAQALLLELSFFEFLKGQPIAEDVIAFVRERGFRLHDIPSLWHRPLDGALAQGDFFFLKEGHPLLADNRWDASSAAT